MRHSSIDVYLNFVLYAVLGRMAGADALMREHGDAVRAIATELRTSLPTSQGVLWRGLLLDPSVLYVPDPRLTFMSWSERRDVAVWFACERSTISAPLAASNPRLRGHLMRLDGQSRTVLFHHAWADAFGGIGALATLAAMHPLMGIDGATQIAWSLRTQLEVITEPVHGIEPKFTPNIDARELSLLEQQLVPPWVAAEEGYKS